MDDVIAIVICERLAQKHTERHAAMQSSAAWTFIMVLQCNWGGGGYIDYSVYDKPIFCHISVASHSLMAKERKKER